MNLIRDICTHKCSDCNAVVYTFSFLMSLQKRLLRAYISLYFIILKLQTFLFVERTLIYKAPLSCLWMRALQKCDMNTFCFCIHKSLAFFWESCVCKTHIKAWFLHFICVHPLRQIKNESLAKWTLIEFSVVLCSETRWPFM